LVFSTGFDQSKLPDLDAPEKLILRKYGIKAFSMHEVDRYGIGQVMNMALDHVSEFSVFSFSGNNLCNIFWADQSQT
jgi:hypothetical protein